MRPSTGPLPKSALQRLGGFLRGLVQPRRIARFDFVSQRRSLAIGDRGMPRRGRLGSFRHRIDGDIRKAGRFQLRADFFHVVIAVRRARHEARRIVWKHLGQRLRHDVGKLVVLDPVPDVEKETAARASARAAPRDSPAPCRERTSRRTGRPPHRTIDPRTAAPARRPAAT